MTPKHMSVAGFRSVGKPAKHLAIETGDNKPCSKNVIFCKRVDPVVCITSSNT